MRLFAVFIFLSLSAQAATGLVYSHILPSLGGRITAITTDSAGNVYITGSTQNPLFPATPGVVQTKFVGGDCSERVFPGQPPQGFTCPDAFVIKLDAQGNVVFATLLGGAGFDEATSIGLDGAGNIYIAGITTSFNFPQATGARFGGGGPTFLAKLNPTATTLLYTALIPGTGDLPFQMPGGGSNIPVSDVTMTMTVDQAGNAYFAGHGTSGFPVTQNHLQTSGPIVAGKLDPTGSTLLYGTYLGGTGFDSVSGIALDSAGDAYITGSTSSKDFPVTPGVLQTSLPAGGTNSFVAKLNATGDKLVYSTYLGANSTAHTSRIRVDGSGNVYVLGSLQSAGYPVTPNAFDTTYTFMAAFLSKLNADGSALLYSTFIRTDGLTPNNLDIDSAGNAYVATTTQGGFPASSDALQPCFGGTADTFVSRFRADGALAAATYWGGSNIDTPSVIAVANDGTVVLMGITYSADFPLTQTPPLTPGNFAPGNFISRFQISDPANATLPCLTLALQNGASFAEGPIAPGELVTLRGLRIGPDMGVIGQLDSTGNIANNAAGVRVLFDRIAAPLLYVQSQQINAQVPWELAGKSVTDVHVEYNGLSTQIAHPDVVPSAPAFFRSYTSSQGAIVNEDGTLNSRSNPAIRGSYVSIFGTGAGPLNPAGITGGISPLSPLGFLALPISVQIDGKDVEVPYAGTAPTISSGVFQINIHLPTDVVPVELHFVDIKAGTQTSDPIRRVTIAIQ